MEWSLCMKQQYPSIAYLGKLSSKSLLQIPQLPWNWCLYWYHSLVSPARFGGNLLTPWSAGKLWVSTQSIVLSKCASRSSSGSPENSGLQYDQFIALGAGGTGCVGIWGAGGTTSWCGGWIRGCCEPCFLFWSEGNGSAWYINVFPSGVYSFSCLLILYFFLLCVHPFIVKLHLIYSFYQLLNLFQWYW